MKANRRKVLSLIYAKIPYCYRGHNELREVNKGKQHFPKPITSFTSVISVCSVARKKIIEPLWQNPRRKRYAEESMEKLA
jgi:hypothetical protein